MHEPPNGLNGTTLARRRTPRPDAIAIAIAALLLFSRAPSRLLRPELWAEDGVLWLQGAYQQGVAALTVPVVGYLQSLSRLCALPFLVLPLAWAPLFFASVSFAAQLAPVALLLSARGAALVPSLPARVLLAAYYVGEPNSSEVYVNLTNAMWHLAIIAFLIVVLPKPRRAWAVAADLAALLLAGLSGPCVLFLAPIAWWQVVRQRGEGRRVVRLGLVYALASSLCAGIQGGYVLAGAGTQRIGHLGASFLGLCRILTVHVFLGGILSDDRAVRFMHAPPAVSNAIAVLASLGGVALLAAAWWRGPTAFRQFMLIGGLILAGGLASPMVSTTEPQWLTMAQPGAGGRYFVIATLGWFAALLIVSARPMRWQAHWLARGLILASLVGVFSDWRCFTYKPNGFQAAAHIFDNAPAGTAVAFPGNPAGWGFTLTKR